MIDKAKLAEWEAIASAAPHPRWIAGEAREDGTVQIYSPSNGPMRVIVPIAETSIEYAAFISAARTAVSALIAALREAYTENEALVDTEFAIKERDEARAERNEFEMQLYEKESPVRQQLRLLTIEHATLRLGSTRLLKSETMRSIAMVR